jgi:uncharacterized protein (TIGR03437 family)
VIFNSNPSQSNASTAAEDSSGAFISGVVAQIENVLTQVNDSNSNPKTDSYPNFNSTLLTPGFAATAPVVNGATYQPGMVSGSWVTITGQNLATATRTWWGDEIVGNTLPVEIDHVRVTISGKNAAVYYVSPAQLNVQAPTDTATGPVNVQVIRDGAASAPIQASYAASAPGFFMYQANGKNFAAGVHTNGAYVGDVAGTLPAKAGETIELFATGLGPSPGGVVPTVTALTPLPAVTVGGQAATVSYAGLVAVGEWQLNVVVPQVAAGELPITISYGGASAAVTTYLAVGN